MLQEYLQLVQVRCFKQRGSTFDKITCSRSQRHRANGGGGAGHGCGVQGAGPRPGADDQHRADVGEGFHPGRCAQREEVSAAGEPRDSRVPQTARGQTIVIFSIKS